MKNNINQYFYYQSLIISLLMMSILVIGNLFDLFNINVYFFVCYLSFQPHLLEIFYNKKTLTNKQYYTLGLLLITFNSSYFMFQVDFNFTIFSLVFLMNSYLFVMYKGFWGLLKYTFLFIFSSFLLFATLGGYQSNHFKLPVEIIFVAYISILIFIIVAANHSFLKENQLSSSKKSLEQEALKLNKFIKGVSKYISPTIVKYLLTYGSDFTINHSRKELVIFFSDIYNFTEISEDLSPEDLNFLLNDYFQQMTEIANKYGGTVDKFIGDSVMIFFGDPTSLGLKEDAVRCVSMAQEMQDKMPELNKKWSRMGFVSDLLIRIGIHQGWSAVGNFGSDRQMTYTVIGQAVNIASRLEQACPLGQILVSDKVKSLTHCLFEYKYNGSKILKGVTRETETYTLVKRKNESKVKKNRYLNLEISEIDGLIGELEKAKAEKKLIS
jgi:adenylate cyclase